MVLVVSDSMGLHGWNVLCVFLWAVVPLLLYFYQCRIVETWQWREKWSKVPPCYPTLLSHTVTKACLLQPSLCLCSHTRTPLLQRRRSELIEREMVRFNIPPFPRSWEERTPAGSSENNARKLGEERGSSCWQDDAEDESCAAASLEWTLARRPAL